MSDETTLLPCPFCSAKPETWSDSRRTWGLVQHNDGCLFPNMRKHEIPEEDFAAWNARAELGSEINGNTSDGYHTFNELYHHRAVLFSVIVRDHRDLAWKARKHHDGTMYDGMFIVGIETSKGQATYHYDLDPYWEMLDCEEREYAPEWDGHTPDEALARIAELESGTCEWLLEHSGTLYDKWRCSKCGYLHVESRTDGGATDLDPNYCPNCGKKVDR